MQWYERLLRDLGAGDVSRHAGRLRLVLLSGDILKRFISARVLNSVEFGSRHRCMRHVYLHAPCLRCRLRRLLRRSPNRFETDEPEVDQEVHIHQPPPPRLTPGPACLADALVPSPIAAATSQMNANLPITVLSSEAQRQVWQTTSRTTRSERLSAGLKPIQGGSSCDRTRLRVPRALAACTPLVAHLAPLLSTAVPPPHSVLIRVSTKRVGTASWHRRRRAPRRPARDELCGVTEARPAGRAAMSADWGGAGCAGIRTIIVVLHYSGGDGDGDGDGDGNGDKPPRARTRCWARCDTIHSPHLAVRGSSSKPRGLRLRGKARRLSLTFACRYGRRDSRESRIHLPHGSLVCAAIARLCCALSFHFGNSHLPGGDSQQVSSHYSDKPRQMLDDSTERLHNLSDQRV
ncbi:hypothetical protein SVAN01_04942 [Stagonosporopsis vannaccii]|nr:hypothetical protein SVAN01_04942 [Stagonosporopsis vannaccii]